MMKNEDRHDGQRRDQPRPFDIMMAEIRQCGATHGLDLSSDTRRLVDFSLCILNWWRDAQYMSSGSGWEERNVFNEDPQFVTGARLILAEHGIADPSKLEI